MPGLPVYSALEGLLTGNVNLVKLPHGDKGLSLAAFSLLVEQEPRLAPYLCAFDLPSKESVDIKLLASLADGIVTVPSKASGPWPRRGASLWSGATGWALPMWRAMKM